MTVYPQEYTLHCVKTGRNPYNFEMRLGGSTVTYTTNCPCSCSGTLLQDCSNTYDHTVTISWDGQTITSGSSFSQSNTGDQTFQCNMWVNNQPRRLYHKIINGIVSITLITFFFSSSSFICSYWYFCQQDSYHYHCQLDCT